MTIKTEVNVLLFVDFTGTVLRGFGEYGLMFDMLKAFKDEKIPTTYYPVHQGECPVGLVRDGLTT